MNKIAEIIKGSMAKNPINEVIKEQNTEITLSEERILIDCIQWSAQTVIESDIEILSKNFEDLKSIFIEAFQNKLLDTCRSAEDKEKYKRAIRIIQSLNSKNLNYSNNVIIDKITKIMKKELNLEIEEDER